MTTTPILRSNRNLSHGRIALGVAIAMALGLPSMSGYAVDPVQSPEPRASASSTAPTSRAVTNCDDDGPGSLRSEVAAAASGDTIDLSALACSTITLTSGAIEVPVDDLAITGPGADALAIDGNNTDRVFTHDGVGTMALSDITIKDGLVNTATPGETARGGCVSSTGNVTLEFATITSCTASGYNSAQGGCVDAANVTTIDSRIDNCMATISEAAPGGYAEGGAIAVASSSGGINLIRSTISNNSAIAQQGGAHGGGIAVLSAYGMVTIQDSTLSGNSVTGRPYVAGNDYFTSNQAMGGAVFSAGPLTITGTTLSDNVATTGGAVAALQFGFADDLVQINNSTISGNMASSMGGGLWVLLSGISLTNSTIAFNQAGYGAGGIMPRHPLAQGIYTYLPNFQSSIIADNTSTFGTADIETGLSGLTIIGSNNIIGESSISVPPDTITGDPLLHALADNGGLTFTHALQPTSPALDAGNNGDGIEFDQRGEGYPRVVGFLADIGAFEYQGLSGIPDSEREFLLEIYNNMHPENWFDATGWNGPPGTECAWYGITCDASEGHVIGVDMYWNSMYGPLPRSLSQQTQLRIFNLGWNGFEGTIPSLSALTNLEVFDVSQGAGGGDGSGLTGGIPSYEGLTQLSFFNVQHNSLSGRIPDLSGLVLLREFWVNNNLLVGAIPEISGLSNIEVFVASENQLAGTIPEISGLSHLRQFYVSSNELDRINDSFDALPALENYVAAYNYLEGEIGSLDGAPNLVMFNVYNNLLTGNLPSLLGNEQLEYFYAHGNELGGGVPAIQGCQQLKYFHVGDNNLTGTIPPIAGMQLLQGFGVSNNQLSGSIPLLEDLPVLFDFEVSNNQLTGSIPPLFGAPGLWEFLANDNLLTGSIPAIGPLHMLVTFNVSNNMLEGPPPQVVPSSLQPINSTNGDVTALCPNNLDLVESSAWDAATGVTPWYRDCMETVDVIYSDGFDGTP